VTFWYFYGNLLYFVIYKEVNLERRLFDKKIGKSGNPAPIKNFLRLDKAGVPVS
jgi:hypothetical protein